MKTIPEINNQINKTKNNVISKYRQKYHMMPTVGWMNDPNGLVYYGNKYHLFYQYDPYNVKQVTMIWGHSTSENLIKFTDESVAIVPEEENVSIFSGGAIEKDGKLVAVYTEHYEKEGIKYEQTYASVSSDGINFEGRKQIFDNAKLPENISRIDFRDPYPIKIGETYYVLTGGKDIELNKGVIVVVGGKTLDNLEYKFTLGPFYALGDMGECPSYYRIGEKDVFVVSGCNVPKRENDFYNVNSSVFVVGNIDFEKGTMSVDLIKEIDKGDSFYAPQFINGADRPIIIAWNEMWGKPYPTAEMGHGWTGAFTIPRVLKLADGDILQQPIDEIKSYYKTYTGKGLPRTSDSILKFSGDGELKIEGENGSVIIGCKKGEIYLDTKNANNKNGCVRKTNNRYKNCEVRVLTDISSIELFVDGGKEAISSRIYIDGEFQLKSSGEVKVIDIKKVEV